MQAGRVGGNSQWEFLPFPILPSMIRVLPGIPSMLLNPSLSHSGWSFPSGLGLFLGIPKVQPKNASGASLVSWLVFLILFFPSSRRIQGAQFHALQLVSHVSAGGKVLIRIIWEIINIYNLEIYIYKKKERVGEGGKKIQEKANLFS